MKRFDLRPLGAEFTQKLIELMKTEVIDKENGIFLFEVGDFSSVQIAADIVKENNWTLMNSIKFNQVDWTVVIKKEAPEIIIQSEEE